MSAVILAATHRAHSSGNSAAGYALVIIGVGLVALVIAGLYFWNSLRKPDGESFEASSQLLFTQLCDVHQLSRPERALLMGIVRANELAQPAGVFVDPESFDPWINQDEDAIRFGALRDKLFGPLKPSHAPDGNQSN